MSSREYVLVMQEYDSYSTVVLEGRGTWSSLGFYVGIRILQE